MLAGRCIHAAVLAAVETASETSCAVPTTARRSICWKGGIAISPFQTHKPPQHLAGTWWGRYLPGRDYERLRHGTAGTRIINDFET